jgi:hypothetical protein
MTIDAGDGTIDAGDGTGGGGGSEVSVYEIAGVPGVSGTPRQNPSTRSNVTENENA